MELRINQRGLQALKQHLASKVLTPALNEAVFVARENVPIETSSLKESIRVSEVTIDGDIISAKLIAGGMDFTHTYFSSTGKMGNVVDYAMEQEIIHNFLSQTIPVIVDSMTPHPL